MKLLTRTLLLYLTITLFVFAGGGLVFYQQLRNILDEEINEQLELESRTVIRYFSLNKELPAQDIILADRILFDTLHSIAAFRFSDTLLLFQPENELLPYRVLSFPVPYNGNKITCLLLKTQLESEDLNETILDALMIIAGILIVVLVLLAWTFSGRLWKNFYHSLEVLRNYQAGTDQPVKLPSSSIPEFNEMNSSIMKMGERIESQFQNLRSFTENASHELQTPLAILRTKIELLLQDQSLNESHHKHLNDLYQTVNRLSKLNQELLTLSKLNNRQFKNETEIDLSVFIQERAEALNELLAFKELNLQMVISPGVRKKIGTVTAEILIGNLLQNALRHNYKGGTINIELKDSFLCISNTGADAELDASKIFERFYRGTTNSDSNGLGLALAKEAAQSCGWKLDYQYKNNLHCFLVSF